jgi:hypothetical protein
MPQPQIKSGTKSERFFSDQRLQEFSLEFAEIIKDSQDLQKSEPFF